MTQEAMADQSADTPETPPTTLQKLLAEFIGTFALVLFGCGVAVVNSGSVVQTGLAFGLTVTLMAYAFGRISGGHFNPAVSVGAALAGRISWRDTGVYVAVQFAGGIVGALVLMILMFGVDGFEAFDDRFALGTNGFSHGDYDYAWWAAFLVELLMTFMFILVILAVTDQRNRAIAALAPLAIGVTLAVIHFMLIPLTGTSVNPARSLGPALFSGGDWIVQVWPFLIAPFVGGAAAGLLYPVLFGRDADPVAGSGLSFGSGGSSDPGFTQQWNQGYPQPNFGQQQDFGGQQQPGYGQGQDQPIIQDGWQWDPASQQWIPAQQPGAQGSSAPAPSPSPAPDQGQGGGWAPPASDQTQVRPPQQ
ncbi:MIP/aquaporin family protein [Nocardioides sp. J54]|uniref:MIP/aquaporin family protein n=1 Tax=Nocardioides sp. J54 TaxID=935866 RepID=UPI000A035EE5|nr:MIP family channel protein [Nocardioides sp. J54]